MKPRYFAYLLVPLIAIGALAANGGAGWNKVKAYYGGYADLRNTPITKLTELAEAGNSDAQRELSYRYEDGNGVARDEAKALFWQERAAIASGAADDQGRVGWMYEMGLGTEENPFLAASWYRRSAAQGNPYAQNSLALLMFAGNGVKQNNDEGCRLLEQSAAQGLPIAESNLAFRLGSKGLCGTDLPRALALFEKAAKAGNGDAAGELGRRLMDGIDVAQDVKAGMRWLETSHQRGIITATGDLGWIYLVGHNGVPQDIAKAEPLLRKAAAQSSRSALTGLGWMYEHGRGVEADIQQAETLYRQAAIEGHPEAQFRLGRLLIQAGAVERINGYTWLTLAKSRNHAAATEWLASYPPSSDIEVHATQLANAWERGQDLPR